MSSDERRRRDRAIGYLTRRRLNTLDAWSIFGLGYLLGAHDLGSWWGRAVFLACAMGATDIAAKLLRWFAVGD